MNSEVYATPKQYSRHPAGFRLISALVPEWSSSEMTVIYTRGPSVAQRFTSNVYRYMLGMVHKLQLKCVVNAAVFPVHHR